MCKGGRPRDARGFLHSCLLADMLPRTHLSLNATKTMFSASGQGYLGVSMLSSMQVATAIRGAIIQAKMSVVPVRRGYWGNKIGKPHTVPTKVRCSCTCVAVTLSSALHACCLQSGGLQYVIMLTCTEGLHTCTRLCEMAASLRAEAQVLVPDGPCVAAEKVGMAHCICMHAF